MTSEGARPTPAEAGRGWLTKTDLWAGVATLMFAASTL